MTKYLKNTGRRKGRGLQPCNLVFARNRSSLHSSMGVENFGVLRQETKVEVVRLLQQSGGKHQGMHQVKSHSFCSLIHYTFNKNSLALQLAIQLEALPCHGALDPFLCSPRRYVSLSYRGLVTRTCPLVVTRLQPSERYVCCKWVVGRLVECLLQAECKSVHRKAAERSLRPLIPGFHFASFQVSQVA